MGRSPIISPICLAAVISCILYRQILNGVCGISCLIGINTLKGRGKQDWEEGEVKLKFGSDKVSTNLVQKFGIVPFRVVSQQAQTTRFLLVLFLFIPAPYSVTGYLLP